MKPLRHLFGIQELEKDQIEWLLEVSREFRNRSSGSEPVPLLKGKTIVNLFFENSTRTRTSFELAIRKLGASVLNFSQVGSSVAKGETLLDTARNIEAMRADALIVRHGSAGSPLTISRAIKLPVINAGDGFHEHPTQALLDAMTMQEKLGSLSGKRVVILGDIAHSRVARSNIYLLRKLGASVAVSGPPTLLPPHPEVLGVEYAYRPEPLLSNADVVMTLRIQLERQNKKQVPSLGEYTEFWSLSKERAKLLKKDCIILHPGPINRGVELDPEVADETRSMILDQVSNGVYVRMAVLAEICAPEALREWLGPNFSSTGVRV
jgi:aspartate carbamoyltransferase catalytic subunit